MCTVDDVPQVHMPCPPQQLVRTRVAATCALICAVARCRLLMLSLFAVTRSNSKKESPPSGPGSASTGRATSPPGGRKSPSVPPAVRNPFGTSQAADAAGAAGRSPPPPAAPAPAAAAGSATAATQLTAKLAARAAVFCEAHFADQGDEVQTAGMKRLKDASAALCSGPEALQQVRPCAPLHTSKVPEVADT